MIAIAVVDKEWGIGKDGELLIHLPGDLKYFKEKTLGKVIVMGRKTLMSLPGGKPLPGRETVVLSRHRDFTADGCTIVHSVDEVLEILKDKDVYIAGGSEVYRQFLPYCDTCLITKIDRTFEADKHFENLDIAKGYVLEDESEPHHENGVSYRFATYRRMTD